MNFYQRGKSIAKGWGNPIAGLGRWIMVIFWATAGVGNAEMTTTQPFVCYGYDDEKKAWKIFDSYDSFAKLYSYDADIMIAKRFHIEKKKAQPKGSSWLEKLLAYLSNFNIKNNATFRPR